jgi:hypothetical protein
MSILSWIFGKGLAGAISADILKKYTAIKSQHPEENNEKILERVWNFWLTLNEEKIKTEDDKHKAVRLSIIKDQHDGKSKLDSLLKESNSLFNLYQDLLYIETEISSKDGRIWHDAMKVFLKDAKKYGMDFSKAYESYKRILG